MAQFDLCPELRVDDKTIGDDAELLRHVDPGQIDNGTISPSAMRTHEMSVFLLGQITVEEVQQMAPGAKVVQFTAGLARSKGLIVSSNPNAQASDIAHKYVYRKDYPGERLSKSQAKALANGARILPDIGCDERVLH